MMIDILEGKVLSAKVLDKGEITIVDVLPRLVPEGRTADVAVVAAARASFGQTVKTVQEDRGVIRYMLRHHHGTPFEAVQIVFRVKLPIFVARQWVRHRMFTINEVSARYTVLPDEFWTPDQWRGQSKTNKQGGEEPIGYTPGSYKTTPPPRLDQPPGTNQTYEIREGEIPIVGWAEHMAFEEYNRRIQNGVSREMARSCLPVSTYTMWQWSGDLRNILQFLSLRMDKHAQREIREYADAMYELIKPIVPDTLQAWDDYVKNSMTFSAQELEAVRSCVEQVSSRGAVCVTPKFTENAREHAEWLEKARALKLIP